MSFGENYKSYLKERQKALILDKPEGFVIYKVNGEECFIIEMFLKKEHRKSDALFELFSDLLVLNSSCKIISGNIHLSDAGCNRTLNAAFKLGFKVAQANNNCLLIVKELGA